MKNKTPLISLLTAALSTASAFSEDPPPFARTPGGIAPITDPPQPPPVVIERVRDYAPLLAQTPEKSDNPKAGGNPTITVPRKPDLFYKTVPEHHEPQPFLGIVTSPLPPALTAQLGLADGFGLLVEEVMPDSPASTAGLQKYDVLKSLNDQQLVNPEQLSALVRGAGKDKEVTITLVRKGQEQKVTAKVGERVLSSASYDSHEWKPVPMPKMEIFSGSKDLDFNRQVTEDLTEEAKRHAEAAKRKIIAASNDLTDKVRRDADAIRAQAKAELDKATATAAAAAKEWAVPGGSGQVKIFKKDGVTTYDATKARLTLKDENGDIEVSVEEGGHRMLTARDDKGSVVFKGSIDTEEERKAVPEQFRDKLDRIKILEKHELDRKGGQSSSISVETLPEAPKGQ